MKKLFLIPLMTMFLLSMLTSCKNENKTKQNQVNNIENNNSTKSKKEVLLVKYHADWCGSCKALSPMLEKLNQKLSGKNTKYVELNLTDNSTTELAKSLVKNHGIAPLAEKQKTGFVSIIDANSKEILGKLTKTQSVDEMYQEVLSHL